MDIMPSERKSNNACEVPLAEANKAASLAECFTDDLVALQVTSRYLIAVAHLNQERKN